MNQPHVPPACRAPPAISESCHTYKWVMSHTWISPMYHPLVPSAISESRREYKWVMAHIWLSHVTRMDASCHKHESCHTCEWVMAHIWNEWWHTYEWVTSHTWISPAYYPLCRKAPAKCESRVTSHIWRNKSCPTYEYVTSRLAWAVGRISFEQIRKCFIQGNMSYKEICYMRKICFISKYVL